MMIASIRGLVALLTGDSVVIEVGGIGVEVLASRQALETCREGEEAALLTRLIVREDSLTLYGFLSAPERELFDVLIKISGVGPKLAITMLSSLSLDNLRQAVANDRVEILTRVPGIGKKTAQKIMLELKDKIPVGLDAVPAGGYSDIDSDVMDALIALGFSVVEAQMAVQSLPQDTSPNTEERILLALQSLNT